jgi:hypothetical protein
MVWRDQDPPATDVLLDFTVPFSGGGSPAYLEIDKLLDGQYRATVGTLSFRSSAEPATVAEAHSRCSVERLL